MANPGHGLDGPLSGSYPVNVPPKQYYTPGGNPRKAPGESPENNPQDA